MSWILQIEWDWGPCYLRDIVMQDFYEFTELWQNMIPDMELVRAAECLDNYKHPCYRGHFPG